MTGVQTCALPICKAEEEAAARAAAAEAARIAEEERRRLEEEERQRRKKARWNGIKKTFGRMGNFFGNLVKENDDNV